MDGERIKRIVLEDGDQSTVSRNPAQLAKPHHVLIVWDVVKHAGGEDDVEVALL